MVVFQVLYQQCPKMLARAAALQSVAVRRLTGNNEVATILFSLGPKLNTKLALNHHPPTHHQELFKGF